MEYWVLERITPPLQYSLHLRHSIGLTVIMFVVPAC